MSDLRAKLVSPCHADAAAAAAAVAIAAAAVATTATAPVAVPTALPVLLFLLQAADYFFRLLT